MMMRLHLALGCALTIILAVHAKPYHHSKKSFMRNQDAFPKSPFAPPAFYDEGEDYEFHDAKWMSWTPAQKQADVDQDKKATTVKSQELLKEHPKKEKSDKLEKKEEKVTAPKLIDPCANVFCKYGRVCQPDQFGEGQCLCAGTDFCKGHSHEVCGTDGNMYSSHCELHRMACVKGVHIGIDHTTSNCINTNKPFENDVHTWEVIDKPPEGTTVLIQKQESDNGRTYEVVKVSKDKDLDNDLIVEKNDSDKLQDDEDKFSPLEKDDGKETGSEKAPVSKDGEKDEKVVVNESKPENSEESAEVGAVDKSIFKSVTELGTPCEELEYERLKNNLLQYHCARIGEMDCTTDPAKKQFVANIMFNYYDLNADHTVTEEELNEIERRDHLEKLSRFCRMADFLTFNDHQGDGNMSLTEFYGAFKIPTVILDESLKVFTSKVTTGNSVELKCDIQGAVEIIWRRNGATLDELISDDIQVFEDGSLYLKNVGLHHIGNYTCQDRFDDQVKQTHVLKVQMLPQVKVSPSTQFHTSGASVTLKCHADGVPEPEIIWQMNEAPLKNDDDDERHYTLLYSNSTLEIRKATYTKDTGAYKCIAKNSAGTSQDIATVFIENSNVPSYSDGASMHEVFFVFHDKGFTVYEPNHCHLEHQVSATFTNFRFMPEYGETLPRLCDEGSCSWGDAINVNDKFIYISQPMLHRVIVVEITDRTNPVEIIPTDKFPVKLHYLEHLDQVWVLCWQQEEDTGSKTAVVIRQASEPIQHHTVHTQPIGNRFDLINDFFLPPSNDLKHKFRYGYVMHHDQQGLYKLDLQAMQYVKNIDLREYNCVPKSVVFVPMGGQVIVHCLAPLGQPEKSSRLVLDYITDQVLEHTALGGEPYLSPDARYLVTVETDGNTISVSKLKDDGKMEHVFDEYTNLHISDVTFFPSDRGHGYDFYASSTNKNDVLFIDLNSGKVEMIEGVGQAMAAEEWPWNTHNRVIVGGDIFGEFLMTPSKDSVIVIDGIRRAIQCEWQNIQHGNVMIWVNPLHL